MLDSNYDVIIVGGRVAGASLAARLTAPNVLLLERGTHPSQPAASSPVIYAPAMSLLDEIGLSEADYAAGTPQLKQWVMEAEGIFRFAISVWEKDGRDYSYAVDRARFDAALWAAASERPNVTARQGMSVLSLLWDDDLVVGVRVKETETGEVHEIGSRLVVGAGGRFDIVAREVGAATYDEHTDEPTSVYYAYWRGVQPLDMPGMHLYSTGGDYGLLRMDSADGTAAIVIEGRTDVLTPRDGERTTAFYHRFLSEHPGFYAALADAEPVTDVHGMKRVGNLYREAGGPGWALVGDALHQKDPLDGQGIYDALYTAKRLSTAINAWCDGADWDAALEGYERDVRQETQPMYHATLARVHREIYNRRPGWFMRYPARWLYEDPAYRRHWSRLFVRDIPPEAFFSMRYVLPALLRGVLRDLRRVLT
ncbi:MAG: NAD(P)/FAD-dependent oxidoreductase [Chloroflexota bacterium]